ncbi:unnamed protein product [Spodoptera littoralis]|uniref:Dynein intermediate chain 3, ciliary n=1 Tax=Spodoptera littoralis TaxID=7109 RepID=A0A9P0N7H1_SPOLI|nr:unnamed protein product [Spodoptera littoralis]CAH1645244.1 unnamed protein product [Spodoptera littoralis]
MDITSAYGVKRGSMGRQVMFCEQPTVLCDSIAPDPAEARRYILRNPVHATVQHAPCFAEHHLNTIRADYTNSGANHSEGGWPEYVNIHDPEATQRYRRKLEKDDGYIRCVMNLTPELEHYVYQNNAIDMYQTYYTELKQYPKLEESDCRTVNIFRDKLPHSGRRSVSSISWQPEGGYRFAVSYVDVDFNRNNLSPIEAYIWDVEQSTSPETTLEPPCPMIDLQFNPREPSVLAGALLNGQVAAWDRRSARAHVMLCPPHVAHRDAVRNVLFINAKSGAELFSGGVDGAIKWWDLRYFTEPTEELILDLAKANEQQTLTNSMGVSSLEFEHTIPTRFMVGTEVGMVITGNRKGKTFAEKLPGKFDAHVGPVWRVERNPGFLKNFLTVGDWTARVWSEECRESAILWTAPHRHAITDGAWSPTRVSLLMLSKCDGVLAVWDLLAAQHQPVLSTQVCQEPLLSVRPHEAGALVCCGNSAGNVYLLELSHDLTLSDKNDKQLLTSVLERESKRERILEARLREIRLKQRQAEESSPAPSLSSLDAAAAGDNDLHQATAEFFSIVKKELTYF